MPDAKQKPYWIDEHLGKHEAYFYGEPDGRVVSLSIRGRSLNLITPDYVPGFEVREARLAGDFLFIIGEQRAEDEEDEEDECIEEGYGIVLVAKRCSDSDTTFWTLIAHDLYPETLDYVTVPPTSPAERDT